MVAICPAILADDPEAYSRQVEEAATYAARLHIDMADGIFTGNALQALADIWWPGGVQADLHVMYKRPFDHLPALIALGPQLVIVHAEADGDFKAAHKILHSHGIEIGVALLAATPVEVIVPALDLIDHVLIFSGDLGHFGGKANLDLLAKAMQLRQIKPQLEIGWDGGVNADNAYALAQGGIDVLNAGGYLHGADPKDAYYRLMRASIGRLHTVPQNTSG